MQAEIPLLLNHMSTVKRNGMPRQFLLLFFLLLNLSVMSQGIHGRITNEQGEKVPFASIYVPKLSSGTTSNLEGDYNLKLPEGNWEVLFQYLGYQTQSIQVSSGKESKLLNVKLITQDYKIPEIKVVATGEDPAYYIMRRAIAMAPYYQKQVSKYSCKVYLKGSGVIESIPAVARLMMKKKEVSEMQQPFVMETVSKIDFELPDKVKQQVLAMRSSGKDNNTSPMGMITNNLYDAEKYGVVSPVGRNAMKVYQFRLDGVFEDRGRTINKIRVIPKTSGNDVFSGYIYIADLFWNIHSADLHMQIPIANVNVHQVYGEVNRNTWMPVSLDFDMDVAGLGLKMKFRYVASISEYQTVLNPALDHTFLDKIKTQQLIEQQIVDSIQAKEKKIVQGKEKTKAQKQIEELMNKPKISNHEMVKLNRLIDSEAKRNSPPEPLEIKSTFQVSQKQVKNDSAYWATLRPIPLTEVEKSSFQKKEQFVKVSAKPEYQDSVKNAKRKFKFKHLIVGKMYDYSVDSSKQFRRFTIPSLLAPTSFSFNSVDGLRLELPYSYYQSDSTGRMKRFNPTLSYAFARKKVDAEFSYQQRIDGMKNSWFAVSGGTTTVDYNRQSGLNTMTNDLYTIWLEENYKRFYRRDFFNLMASRDLSNGLNLNVSLDYSANSPLKNHSNFSIIDYKDKEIQLNIPQNQAIMPWQLDEHQTFGARIMLEYTPRNRYTIRNHTKFYAGSKFPTFSVTYKGAFPGVLGSDSRFDLVKFGMRQQVKFGIDEHLSYSLNLGGFMNHEKVYFEDFQHFNIQSTGFMFNASENSFRLLPFYTSSTQKTFAEAHANWESRRLILKQLPVIRNSSFSENVYVNYLSTSGFQNYAEIGYGLKRVFLMLNVDAVAGFENGRYRSAGIKVSLNLK